jgi:hypothetical protein
MINNDEVKNTADDLQKWLDETFEQPDFILQPEHWIAILSFVNRLALSKSLSKNEFEFFIGRFLKKFIKNK